MQQTQTAQSPALAQQIAKANAFADLHKKGDPVILFNIWDAGSARAVEKAGAKALASGSASIAESQGYSDGEAIPLDFLLQLVERITTCVDLPVSIDFEGGYAKAPADLIENVTRLMKAGAIGLNFEDQVVGGEGLYDIDMQMERIAALRQAAEALSLPLFINARTDLFLKEMDRDRHAELLTEACIRATAYEEAGASSFFAPGLVAPDLIGQLCDTVNLPVNILKMGGAPEIELMAKMGVARVSFGPYPYRDAMRDLKQHFERL